MLRFIRTRELFAWHTTVFTVECRSGKKLLMDAFLADVMSTFDSWFRLKNYQPQQAEEAQATDAAAGDEALDPS